MSLPLYFFLSFVEYAHVIIFKIPINTNIFLTVHYTSIFIIGALLAKHKDF